MFRRKDEESAPVSAEESATHAAENAPSHAIAPAAAPAAYAPVATAPQQNLSYAPAASVAAAAPAASSAPVATQNRAPEVRLSQPMTGYRPAPAAPAPASAPRVSSPANAAAQATAASASLSTEKAPAVKPNRRVLTVGNDILLKGEIATCDRLVIEGRVEAKLSDVHTVEIAECGSFKGTAEVEDAEISGVFEGDLIVRNRLVIYATGEVRGNIGYGEIEIERGGKLTGQIKTVAANATPKATAPSAALSVDKARSIKEAVAA